MLIAAVLLGTCHTGMAAQRQSQFTFSGKVKDSAGQGIKGVVVNNGYNFTTTDSSGAWKLDTDTALSKYVTISVPAAYELPSTDGLADGFYVHVRDLRQGKPYNFTLKKRENTANHFYYLPISDPQIYKERDMRRWRTEAVPDIKQTVDSLRRYAEVVGNTLGDLVFDNMSMWAEYKESVKNMGMTVFQCIGNHDFDAKYQDLHNMELGAPHYAEAIYNHFFDLPTILIMWAKCIS